MRIGTPYQLKKKITNWAEIFLNYFELICRVNGMGAKNGLGRKLGAGHALAISG